MKEQRYRSMDEAIAAIKHLTLEDIRKQPHKGPHLFTVDMLRAAGALDFPPSWRKSLKVERDLFSDVVEEDEDQTEEDE